MIRFGIRVMNVSPARYEQLRQRLFGRPLSIDYQEGNVLIFGHGMYWQLSLLLGDCLYFGNIECGIAREETE